MADYSLSDTIALMTSDDYKDRFKAEYFQTKLRYDKLKSIIVKADAGIGNCQSKLSLCFANCLK